MNIDAAFPARYLKHTDLQGRAFTVLVVDVRMEDIGGDEKPVLYAAGTDRGLPLNRTNAGAIAQAYGAETEAWRGRPVTLYPDKTMYQGRMVDCIRVRVPPPEPAAHGGTPPVMPPGHAASMSAQAPAAAPAAAGPGAVTSYSGAALLGAAPHGMTREHAASMAAQAPAPTWQPPEAPARGTAATNEPPF
jgi:hypothetical protein